LLARGAVVRGLTVSDMPRASSASESAYMIKVQTNNPPVTYRVQVQTSDPGAIVSALPANLPPPDPNSAC
jgi:hypothetical protein